MNKKSIVAAVAVTLGLVLQGGVVATAAPSVGAVTGVSAYYRADLGYMVGWTAPANKTGVTGYTVTSNPGGKTCKASSASAVKCVFPASALAYGTTYTFTVTSGGVNAVSDASNSVTSATIPNAPLYVAAGSASNDSIDLAWVPSAVSGGAPLYGYKITYWKSDSVGNPIEASRKEVLATTTGLTVSGLSLSTMYIFNVASCNAYGCNSANTWTYKATTPSSVALSAIKLPTVISGGSASTKCFEAVLDAMDGSISGTASCPSVVIDPATYPVVVPGATSIAQGALATKFAQTAVISGLSKNYSMTAWSATGGVNWFAYFLATSKSPVLGFTAPASVVSSTPNTCVVSGNWILFKGVGVCSVSGSVAGNDVFLAATTAKVLFNITK